MASKATSPKYIPDKLYKIMKSPFGGKEKESEQERPDKEDSVSITSTSDTSDGDENKERGNWGSKAEFILSCVGFTVGFGNIWRFPYLCMSNGGGAFLIPYFFFLFTCGVPLFFLEVALGQFSGSSPLKVWRICPLFKGLGYGMTLVVTICATYYNIIMAWILFYLGSSFTSELPWTHCQNLSDNCVESTMSNSTFEVTYNSSRNSGPNMTLVEAARNVTNKTITPAEEFWQYTVLKLSPGVDQLGEIRWQLLLCLLAAWIIVFLCLCKGIKSSGKVVYVTATLPYVCLTILLVRGLTLDGAIDGIMFFLTPDFEKLADLKVWALAALQIFYTLGPAWGGLITMSSYNKFNNNVYRDAIMVPLTTCLTSFYGGFVIFSVIGVMAKEVNKSVKDVITEGPGLAFVAYPEALTKLPISPLWSIIFFLMLFTVGLDSQFVMIEIIVTGIIDEFPEKLRSRKLWVIGGISLLLFILGLPFVTEGGIYVLQLTDWYIAAISIMVMALCECLLVSWVYGATRFRKEIAMMTHIMPTFAWEILWRGLTPFLMSAALIYNLQGYSAPTFGDYKYPAYAISIGWMIAISSALPIPIYMIYILYHTEGTLWQRIKTRLRPAPTWGPSLEEYREDYDPQVGPQKPLQYYLKKREKRGKETEKELLDMTPSGTYA